WPPLQAAIGVQVPNHSVFCASSDCTLARRVWLPFGASAPLKDWIRQADRFGLPLASARHGPVLHGTSVVRPDQRRHRVVLCAPYARPPGAAWLDSWHAAPATTRRAQGVSRLNAVRHRTRRDSRRRAP